MGTTGAAGKGGEGQVQEVREERNGSTQACGDHSMGAEKKKMEPIYGGEFIWGGACPTPVQVIGPKVSPSPKRESNSPLSLCRASSPPRT